MLLPRVTLLSLTQLGVQQALDLLTRAVSLQLGKVRISALDTTLGFLGGKLVAGSSITLTVLNPGGNEQLSISSEQRFNVVPTAVSYPAMTSDYVLADTTGGSLTVTLPTAAGNAGRMIGVKKLSSDGFSVNVTASGGQFIDGQTTQSIADQFNAMLVLSDGANWWII